MLLQSCVRNEFGKCDHPAKTIERIIQGFTKIGVEDLAFDDADESAWASKNLYWGLSTSATLRTRTVGKGNSRLLAQASGHAELAERFSSLYFRGHFDTVNVFFMTENAKALQDYFRYTHMPGYVHAHQDELEDPLRVEEILIHEGHLRREDLDEIKAGENARHWIDAFSLMENRTRKVPPVLIRYVCGTNGLASGNTLEEAIIHGACEIFERYALRKVIREEEVPTVDIASITNPDLLNIIESFRKDNVDVLVKDFSDGGVLPCVGILTINGDIRSSSVEHRMVHLGASLDMDEALMRCFAERVQGRVDLEPSDRFGGVPCVSSGEAADYYFLLTDHVTNADLSFLEEGDRADFRRTEKIRDCLQEIERIKEICSTLNTDFIVVDHTHPVLEFPVVRVIMPGISDTLAYHPMELRSKHKFIECVESACAYEKGVMRLIETFG
ncbi:YcaO-like family protein [Thermodesulfobacteriota bacterium]